MIQNALCYETLRLEPFGSALKSLSSREREVVSLVVDGPSNKDVAEKLSLTEGTVKLHVEVQGTYILISVRGTCLRAKYREQDAPWLATDGYGPDDPEAPITFSEFPSLAWATANETARRLGWIRTCNELHQDLQQTA